MQGVRGSDFKGYRVSGVKGMKDARNMGNIWHFCGK